MKKIMLSFMALGLSTVLTGCYSGGGSTGYDGYYYTHEDLANEFVNRINYDYGSIQLELVKVNTEQYDYIVVYDTYYGTYDAYWLGGYNVGEDVYSYMQYNDYLFYYDLIPEWGNVYRDPYSGIRFEMTKVEPTSKDLAKMKAVKEAVLVNKAANQLKAQYGLSAEKSLQAARFAYKLQTAPAGTYKTADYDKFTKELTGSSISEFQKDVRDNNVISLAERVQRASEETGMGAEGVNRFIKDVFIK